jgi:type II secretory pathway component PulF
MPFFRWYALTSEGQVHRGLRFARNVSALTLYLLDQQLALVRWVSRSSYIPYRRLVHERVALFQQLGWLLISGVHLTHALAIVAEGATDNHVRVIVRDCAEAVGEGIALSDVAVCHSELFSPFVCRMLLVGERSGSLGKACTDLAAYDTIMATFADKLRSAILMPLITLGMFIVMVGVLFYAVIPRFGAILKTLKGPLPARTQFLLTASEWLRSPGGMILVGAVLIAALASFWYVRRSSRHYSATVLSYIPFIRLSIDDLSAALFFRTLSSLLCGGVNVTQALTIAPQSIASNPVRQYYEQAAADVAEGASLSKALHDHVSHLAPGCYALLQVGEATGKLGPMAAACADFYQARVVRWCTLIGYLAQPILLLILGVLVALLMLSLYEPIFSIGMLISQ